MAPLRVSTTKSEWLPDDPTAFVPTRLWKLPFITTWDDSRNQNHPTDSAEEAEIPCSRNAGSVDNTGRTASANSTAPPMRSAPCASCRPTRARGETCHAEPPRRAKNHTDPTACRVSPVMNDGGCGGGVGAACGEHADEVLGLPRPAAGDDGNVGGARNGFGEGAIETVLHAIGIHGGEQHLAGAERFAARGPRYGVDMLVVAPAAGVDVPSARSMAAGVDSQHDGLRAEFVAQFGDEFGTAHGGGVDGDLVGAGHEDAARVSHGADAAADAERDEDLARGARHHVGHDFTGVARGGDIAEAQFVCAIAVVPFGQFHGAAGIAQVDEVDSLDDASAGDIETGDDAFG